MSVPRRYASHDPNLGRSVGMAGGRNGFDSFDISSHDDDGLQEGMVFVLCAR